MKVVNVEPTGPDVKGPRFVVVPSGFVIFKEKPRHRSPPSPPAVGGYLSSHMTMSVYWFTPTVSGEVVTKAYVGIFHAGVCELAEGIFAAIASDDSRRTTIATEKTDSFRLAFLFLESSFIIFLIPKFWVFLSWRPKLSALKGKLGLKIKGNPMINC